MDTNNRWFIILACLILASVGFVFYKYYVKQDFTLFAKVECDPNISNCFVSDCDVEDPRCLGEETIYYKFVYKNAADAPPFDCGDEEECEIIECSDEVIEEYEVEAVCSADESNTEEIPDEAE